MSKRGTTCAAMTLALVILSTGAKAENLPPTIFGAGTMSCGQFAEYYQRDPDGAQLFFFSWVQGYISGFFTFAAFAAVASGMTSDELAKQPFFRKSMDPEVWFLHIRRFCDNRPLASVYEAANDLMEKLRAK